MQKSTSKDNLKRYAGKHIIDRDMVAMRVRELGGDKKLTKASILSWRPDIDENALDNVLSSLKDSELQQTAD